MAGASSAAADGIAYVELPLPPSQAEIPERPFSLGAPLASDELVRNEVLRFAVYRNGTSPVQFAQIQFKVTDSLGRRVQIYPPERFGDFLLVNRASGSVHTPSGFGIPVIGHETVEFHPAEYGPTCSGVELPENEVLEYSLIVRPRARGMYFNPNQFRIEVQRGAPDPYPFVWGCRGPDYIVADAQLLDPATVFTVVSDPASSTIKFGSISGLRTSTGGLVANTRYLTTLSLPESAVGKTLKFELCQALTGICSTLSTNSQTVSARRQSVSFQLPRNAGGTYFLRASVPSASVTGMSTTFAVYGTNSALTKKKRKKR